ncbi:MAG: DUF3035 domain-containing protein [Candidatus Rickettsia vulgarisii]
MRIFWLLATILLTTSACSGKIKETIGITTTGPDEYVVTRNKSLEMPPHYELPPVQTEGEKIGNDKKVTKDLNEGEKALMKEIEK